MGAGSEGGKGWATKHNVHQCSSKNVQILAVGTAANQHACAPRAAPEGPSHPLGVCVWSIASLVCMQTPSGWLGALVAFLPAPLFRAPALVQFSETPPSLPAPRAHTPAGTVPPITNTSCTAEDTHQR